MQVFSQRLTLCFRVGLLVACLDLFSSPVFARELLTFDGTVGGEQLTVLAKSKVETWQPQDSVTAKGPAPAGRAVRLSGEKGSGFVAKSKSLSEVDWRKSGTLAFWVHRSADEVKEHPTVSLDVQLIEEDRQAHFWRKLDLNHTGWKLIEMPLDWFRWSNSRIPRWDKVRSLAFLLRESSTLTFDTVWTESTETARGDFPSAELVAPIAFPKDDNAEKLRSLETRDVQLLTNAKSLDMEQLAGHLASVAKEIRREMPFLPEPDRGAVLVVFQTRDEYRQFVPRFARQLNSESNSPESAGYTVEGVSTSSWDAQYGTLRPVYTHEFVHGYLCRTLRLASHGDWLHEGLASRFQLKLHPQADFNEFIKNALKNPKAHDPLRDLCDGHRIVGNRYWQAATLCQMLLTDERYRAGWPILLERLREARSNDLGPHLEPVWQTDFDKLTIDWRAFSLREFGLRDVKKPDE
ncbi:MAG: carbohydrate binding domain-containing protein [Planctomycetaceae bacterium]